MALVLGVVGCGGGSATKTEQPPAAKTEHEVSALDLLLNGPEHAAAWRARPARRTRVWLTPKQPSQTGSDAWKNWYDDYIAIQEVRDNRVRVFDEYDRARLLLWIPREDLAPTIVRETAVAMPGAVGDLGVVARTGVPVTARRDEGGDSHVTVEANGLHAEGVVPLDAVGDVWFADAPPVQSEGSDKQYISIKTTIRAAAGVDAPVFATTMGSVDVRVHAGHDDWTEVQTLGSLLIARGMVETIAVEKYEEGDDYVPGFGPTAMADFEAGIPSVLVPTGTCLYDAVDGELVGVATKDAFRTIEDEAGEWTSVEIWTHWGPMKPWIHGVEHCGDPIVDPASDP